MAAERLPCSARWRTRRRPTDVRAVSVPLAAAATKKHTTKTMSSIHSWPVMTKGLSEELGDAPVFVHPDDRLGEQRCHGQHRDGRTELVLRDRHRVRHYHLFHVGLLHPVDRVTG